MARLPNLFQTRSKALIGVDISTTRVKLLELDGHAGAYRVLSYASEALPIDAVADHQIINAEAVAESLSRALERSGTKTRNAAIAVSGPAVISKIIDLPAAMSDSELEQQINLDAEQYIPYPINEVNLDFQVLEADPVNPDLNRILLVACRRDNIEMRTAALEMARLKVSLVDVEEYALQNACSLLSQQSGPWDSRSGTAVFDIGAEITRLTVQRDGRSAYTRDISFGGRALAVAIMDRHQLNDSDQLRARIRGGEIAAEAIADDVRDFAERVANHIQRSLQFYVSASASDSEAVDRVVVAGGSTLFPGFEDALRTILDRPFVIGNPLAGMLASVNARRNHVDNDGPSLMVAAGLALRGLR